MPIDLPLATRRYTAEVSGPANPTPIRRPYSIRRTSTIDICWPNGLQGNANFVGRCRDMQTLADMQEALLLDSAELLAEISPDRFYVQIAATPDRSRLQELVGTRAGGGSRTRMVDLLHQDKVNGAGLYLLMDDLPAAGLISGYITSEWIPADQRLSLIVPPVGSLDDICMGLARNSSAHDPQGGVFRIHQVQAVGPLERLDDPLAWHEHAPDRIEPSMRRARRIDVWLDDSDIEIDAFFQDSVMTPDGTRVAVHEYGLLASAHAADGCLSALTVDPHVLPFDECPNAVRNADRMLGKYLGDFRSAVLETLPGIEGCTHLNDMLRSLAEVPMLADELAKLY